MAASQVPVVRENRLEDIRQPLASFASFGVGSTRDWNKTAWVIGGVVGSTAVRIKPVWDDPSRVVELIRRAGPFWPLANYAASDAEMLALGRQKASFTPPWFRQDFAREGRVLVPGADVILGNGRFVHAARELAGGVDAVVRPQAVYVNIMGPTPFAFPPHLDIPAFRGFTRSTQPVWLLKTMKTSGLFEAWRTKIATGVSWFYAGPGGDFYYWPDGPGGPRTAERAPYDNVAILADNESTFHGVAPLGAPGATMPEGLSRDSRLVRSDSGWSIQDAVGTEQAHVGDSDVRITVSWKADVFANTEEAELHDRGDSPLTFETVVELFRENLAAGGTNVRPPTDPLHDQEWIRVLASTYQDPAPAL